MGTAGACNPPHKAATQYIALCRECMDLLLELDAPVEYIILTTHAYEHKVFVPSFQRRFPQAQVYYSPKCAPSPPAALCLWKLLVNVDTQRALHSNRRHIRRSQGHKAGQPICCAHTLLPACLQASGREMPQSVPEGRRPARPSVRMMSIFACAGSGPFRCPCRCRCWGSSGQRSCR